MKNLRFLFLAAFSALALFSAAPASAASYDGGSYGSGSYGSGSAATATDSYKIPDDLAFGIGWFGFDRSNTGWQTADFRLDYRWGLSLLPLISGSLSSLDQWLQIHPYVGLEGTAKSQFYATGGLAADIFPCKHIVFTPSTGFGLYDAGDGKHLGGVPEFRSTFEAGWRFDNNARLTAYISHISNAGLGDINPGEETIGLYLHVPVNQLF
jgi:hypothetical protein